MATAEQINAAAKGTDAWLKKRQKLHLKMVNESIITLQNNIMNSLHILKVNDAGKIAGVAQNWTKAQSLHGKIVKLFKKDFDSEMRKVVNDFGAATTDIAKNFETVGEIVNFTGVDQGMMTALRDGYYQDYLAIGNAAQQKITRGVYQHVIGGSSFSSLETSIRTALVGSKAVSATGRPLSNYARLYARDNIRNYHNDVMMTKADELEMTFFKYIGTIMAASRRFCIQRRGRVFSKKMILSWTYPWKGKSGDAMHFRGGYNCRHHWQPVRKEWLDKKEQEKIDKLIPYKDKSKKVKPEPKPVIKLVKPVIKPKVKPKPPEVMGKGTIPNAPTAKSIEKDLIVVRSTDSYKAIIAKRNDLSIEIKSLEKKRDSWMTDEYPKIKPLTDKMVRSEHPLKYHQKIQAIEQIRYDVIEKIAETEKQRVFLKNRMLQKERDLLKTKIMPPAGGQIKFKTASSMSQTMHNRVTRNFKETETLLHPDVIAKMPEQYIRYESGIRSYYTPVSSKGNFQRPSSLHLGGSDPFIQTHEFGHAIEYGIPGAQKRALEFLKKRAGKDQLTKIAGTKNEWGWSDGFMRHYTGKHYPQGATEIISMGLEQMHRNPMTFFKQDPGHFDFILKIMWGAK